MKTSLKTVALAALLLGGCAGTNPASTLPKTPPVVAPLPPFTAPTVVEDTLANGARLQVVEDHLLPLVSVRLVLPGGALDDPPGRWGRAALTAAMLNESAGALSTIERAEALKLLAASVYAASERAAVQVEMDVSTPHYEAALALMADAVLRPAFKAEDWERVQRLHVNSLKHNREDGPSVAREVAALTWFGATHPGGSPSQGTPGTASALGLEDVKAYHGQVATPAGATFVVVGDIDPARAKATLEAAFAGWTGAANPTPELPEVSTPTATRVVLVDMPGSAQTALRVMGPGFAAGDTDEPAATLVGTVLGGSFTSRLNTLMREEKGYTYGVGAGFLAGREAPGYFMVSTSVRTDATGEAVADLLGVLTSASAGYSELEVQKARAQTHSTFIEPLETRSGAAAVMAQRTILGRAPSTWAAEAQASQAADAEAMKAVAQKYIRPEHLVLVLVGDKAAVLPQIEALGLTVELVTPLP